MAVWAYGTAVCEAVTADSDRRFVRGQDSVDPPGAYLAPSP
jgi:hypothetical protein